MKRIFTAVLLMLAVVNTTQARSLKFGLKGGLNVTSMSFDEKVFDSSNKAGFFIGPTAQISLPLGGLGVDISALYDQKESKVNDNSIKQQSILIPVNLRLKLGLGSRAGVYLAAGPQFGFNVGDSKYTWQSLKDIKGTQQQIDNEFQLKKSNFSINLGAGIYLNKHFEIGFAYNIAMGKTADATFKEAVNTAIGKTEDDAKAKTWTISAAILF